LAAVKRTLHGWPRAHCSVLARAIYPQRPDTPETALDAWTRSSLARLSRKPAPWEPCVTAALALEDAVRPLADIALAEQLRHHARQMWPSGARDRKHAPWALALVREAAWRSLGLQPFATQLGGATCLLNGELAEMRTGEGKTLTAGLAAAVAACAGVPVHVATVNDYLAERDAQELAPLFSLLGLTVGSVITGMPAPLRQARYRCDICYCSAKELVFDYLKDQAAAGASASQVQLALRGLLGRPAPGLLLRGLHFAIVDEADSVFIDEARTPLILSQTQGPAAESTLYPQALATAQRLQIGTHFLRHLPGDHISLTAAGRLWLAEHCASLAPAWAQRATREHLALQALRALHQFQRDLHYIVKDEGVQIVDEQTGRVLPGRMWEQGLHQMIETKEGCKLSDPTLTLARITTPRFFRRYLRLSGMTGTAQEVRGELSRVYRLETTVMPTHRPGRCETWPLRCEPDIARKWACVADSAAAVLSQGRPVLIGTRSVAASEALAAVLQARGLPHQLLNARQDGDEAALIAQAGTPGHLTLATNMAGRGTDIKLSAAAREAGGLHVILTEFHDSQRTDRQLFGRAARQGDPGSVQAIVSLQDTLFAQHAPGLARAIGSLGTSPLATLGVELLRLRAQRLAEQQHARTRSATLRDDSALETSLAFTGKT
jgi:preprotein translocase subunit SecA